MRGSVVRGAAASILRGLIAAALARVVARGLLEPSLAQETATFLAFFLVDRVIELWRLHRVALYERALVIAGISARPHTAPEVVQAEARALVRDGLPNVRADRRP